MLIFFFVPLTFRPPQNYKLLYWGEGWGGEGWGGEGMDGEGRDDIMILELGRPENTKGRFTEKMAMIDL